MLFYINYNNNSIRKKYGFTEFNNPNILESDILTILNKIFNNQFTFLDFNNPIIKNYYVQYINADNPEGWGLYPLEIVYNDMVNCIKNMNLTNNYIVKLESIGVEYASRYRCYYNPREGDRLNILDPKTEWNADIAYEILYYYLSQWHCVSYKRMMNDNRRILIFHTEDSSKNVTHYILSIGFNQYSNSNIDYFSSAEVTNDLSRYTTYQRSCILNYALKVKLGPNNPTFGNYQALTVVSEYNKSSYYRGLPRCKEFIDKLDLNKTGRGIYDGNYKYENFIPNQEYINICNNSKPATMFKYINYNNNTFWYNKYSHVDRRIDFAYFRKENTIINQREIALKME